MLSLNRDRGWAESGASPMRDAPDSFFFCDYDAVRCSLRSWNGKVDNTFVYLNEITRILIVIPRSLFLL